jgi:hypothetical protein
MKPGTIMVITVTQTINKIEMMQTAATMKLGAITTLAKRLCHDP